MRFGTVLLCVNLAVFSEIKQFYAIILYFYASVVTVSKSLGGSYYIHLITQAKTSKKTKIWGLYGKSMGFFKSKTAKASKRAVLDGFKA